MKSAEIILLFICMDKHVGLNMKIKYVERPCRKMTESLHGDFHQKILRSIMLIKYLLTFYQITTEAI